MGSKFFCLTYFILHTQFLDFKTKFDFPSTNQNMTHWVHAIENVYLLCIILPFWMKNFITAWSAALFACYYKIMGSQPKQKLTSTHEW